MKSTNFVNDLSIFDLCLISVIYKSGGSKGDGTTSETP